MVFVIIANTQTEDQKWRIRQIEPVKEVQEVERKSRKPEGRIDDHVLAFLF